MLPAEDERAAAERSTIQSRRPLGGLTRDAGRLPSEVWPPSSSTLARVRAFFPPATRNNTLRAAFREALRIDPTHADLRQNLAIAFSRLIINLVEREQYRKAWNAVHRAQGSRVDVYPPTLVELKKKMPKPERD